METSNCDTFEIPPKIKKKRVFVFVTSNILFYLLMLDVLCELLSIRTILENQVPGLNLISKTSIILFSTWK